MKILNVLAASLEVFIYLIGAAFLFLSGYTIGIKNGREQMSRYIGCVLAIKDNNYKVCQDELKPF